MAPQVYALRHQPMRAVYIFGELLATLFVRLPYWLVKNIPRTNRPRTSWTYMQCIRLDIIRSVLFFGPIAERAGPIVQEPDHRALHDSPGMKGVWLDPVPSLILGEVKQWATAGDVESVRIPGYWYDKEGHDTPVGESPKPGEKVLYMIHGGAFIGLSAHPKFTFGPMFSTLVGCHPSIRRGLAVEYRLTTGPPLAQAHPFPAALMDVIAGYAYLTDVVGFSPEDIIIEGDSAGGNLAIALVRYILENRTDQNRLPAPPGALLLVSPWVDLGDSHNKVDASQQTCLASDVVPDYSRPLMFWARQNYCNTLGFPQSTNTNRYISPASLHPEMEPVTFKRFPRTFILYGDAETLFDQDLTLKDKMVADLGNEWVQYHVAEDGVHEILVFAFFESQYTKAYGAIQKWLEQILV